MGKLYEQAVCVRDAMRRVTERRGTASADDVILSRAYLPEWTGKAWKVDELCACDGRPWRCVQAHDSTGNASWKPGVAVSLWATYHGTIRACALAYVAPTGAHDAYQTGEWAIWTDGKAYKCLRAGTVHDPATLASAWEVGA